MSIDLKNTKEKSLQPFLLPSSIMNLKKDYKNNRKSDSHRTELRARKDQPQYFKNTQTVNGQKINGPISLQRPTLDNRLSFICLSLWSFMVSIGDQWFDGPIMVFIKLLKLNTKVQLGLKFQFILLFYPFLGINVRRINLLIVILVFMDTNKLLLQSKSKKRRH